MNESTRIIGANLSPDGIATMSTDSFVAVISIHIKPDCVEEFLKILSQVADAVRPEPTLLTNIAHQDPEDPTKFMLWEMWSDQRNFFEVQMKREYRKPYETRLPDLLAEPRIVKIWRLIRGHMASTIPNKIISGEVPLS